MTQEEWRDSINQFPEESERKLVYSDWLEEQGELGLANGIRWLVEAERQPTPHACGNSYYWFVDCDNGYKNSIYRVAAVSDQLFDRMIVFGSYSRLINSITGTSYYPCIFYNSYFDSIQALAKAWAQYEQEQSNETTHQQTASSNL